MSESQITLGGGCFWCTEAVFMALRGVTAVEPGYCNGHSAHTSYEAVCTGTTGHCEVVQVSFDPQVVSLHELLQVFFATHDPTTLNRQGHDVGTQYRSGIYLHHEAQRAEALAVLALAQADCAEPVVTEVVMRHHYSTAEAYHHRYFERNPHQGYCRAVIAPKVGAFREAFKRLLR